MQVEYHVFMQEIDNNIKDDNLTFVINHMKCRTICVVYFVLHCYDVNHNEIKRANKAVYVGKRWVVDQSYSKYIEKFTIPESLLEKTSKVQVELVAIGIDDNKLNTVNAGVDHAVNDVVAGAANTDHLNFNNALLEIRHMLSSYVSLRSGYLHFHFIYTVTNTFYR